MVVRALVLALLVAGGSLAAAAAEPQSPGHSPGHWRALLSPGPLVSAHAASDGDCESCHVPYAGIPDARCLGCHEGVASRIEAATGFHAEVSGQSCIECHTDHRGRSRPATSAIASDAFRHERTGFTLEAAHAGESCDTCHTGPLERMSPRCVACHADPHEARLGGDTCADCHWARAWSKLAYPSSAHETSLAGGHAALDCETCHDNGFHLEASVACADCHEDAHGGTDAPCDTCHAVTGFESATFDHGACGCELPEDHQTAACLGCHPQWNFVDTPTLCSDCHEKDRKHEPLGECSLCHFATSWEKPGNFRHDEDASFPLQGKHLSQSCDACHQDFERFRDAPASCTGCHADRGRAAHGDFGSYGDCSSCHDANGFANSSFGHDRVGFSLTGAHEDTPCQECHGDSTPDSPTIHRNRPSTIELARLDANVAVGVLAANFPPNAAATSPIRGCNDCHEDVHAGSVGSTCTECHTTSAWRPSTFDAIRHAETRLPLSGEHARVDCDQCHLQGRLQPTPTACADCHLDRHDGLLGDACETCHSARGFLPVEDFDHALTGFPHEGPHIGLDCGRCHEGERGRAMAEADDATNCGVCHPAPHNEDLGSDCQACHAFEDGAAFAEVTAPDFAHAKTGFPLTRRHRGLACSACHVANEPTPSPECADCHLDPHAGGIGTDCAQCHRPDRWRLARFDHAGTSWPLRGRHATTACASCHPNQRWVGVPTDCYGCHALDTVRAPAQPVHDFALIDCQDCHGLTTWRLP